MTETHFAETDLSTGRNLSGGYVATLILAVVLGVFGLVILAGGVWLILLGGSWYYAIAGIGLCLTAWFLVQPSMTALWVYLATFVFTLIWALWERGLDPWAQVPRLVAPSVVLILVLLTVPVLRKNGMRARRAPS
ncbi:MAG: glucose dehydrogenase [Pseudomonadota bacterium]|nr:glucose dehydrogenase [Pseudomonadota bacterium]